MARSTYVYVALYHDAWHDEVRIEGTWTVKKEMVGWLRRTDPDGLSVYRCRDGWRDKDPVLLDIAELLA